MQIYLVLVCGGIAFFAISQSSDLTLFDDYSPLNLSLETEDELGSTEMLDDDSFSSVNSFQCKSHA